MVSEFTELYEQRQKIKIWPYKKNKDQSGDINKMLWEH